MREPPRFVQKVRPIDVQERCARSFTKFYKKMMKKKKKNSRVCRILASGTIGVF